VNGADVDRDIIDGERASRRVDDTNGPGIVGGPGASEHHTRVSIPWARKESLSTAVRVPHVYLGRVGIGRPERGVCRYQDQSRQRADQHQGDREAFHSTSLLHSASGWTRSADAWHSQAPRENDFPCVRQDAGLRTFGQTGDFAVLGRNTGGHSVQG